MSLLDKRTGSDGLKLLVFIVVTALATGSLVAVIGNLSWGRTTTYKAQFTDVTGVTKGDDIRAAGVKVGTVKAVSVSRRTTAEVTFDLNDDVKLTRSSEATIKYRNLVGQRYIALTLGNEPSAGGDDELKPGAVIPLSRTHPALDLTVLFNGFKPLFAALSPNDVNQLSGELIAVFQGEGGTLQGLLKSTASVTNTLADRDRVINELISNLNTVLATLGKRDKQISALIVQFRSFLSGLVKDKDAILQSLDSISTLSEETADLTVGLRPPLVRDVKALRSLATNLNRGRREIDNSLQVLPIKLTKLGRTATYGSFFNFYLCQFQGRAKLPTGRYITVKYNTANARCRL